MSSSRQDKNVQLVGESCARTDRPLRLQRARVGENLPEEKMKQATNSYVWVDSSAVASLGTVNCFGLA
eukprot:3103312-Amphidinium_carterae.1